MNATRPKVLFTYYTYTKQTLKEKGGEYLDGTHFSYQGGQLKSLFSLLSYLGTGEYRDRYLGAPIPPTNIQEHHLDAARTFANGLADQISAAPSPSTGGDTRESARDDASAS